jgi:uncharacterized protein (DUF1697 family)
LSRYACLLRGVNVSGARPVKMDALRARCEAMGHTDVATYLQSGNVVLSSRAAPSELGTMLSDAIRAEFGHADLDVLVWTADALERLVRDNPFVALGREPAALHVTLLATEVDAAAVEAIGPDRFLPDEFAPGDGAVYVHCPNGYGRTKLTNALFERKLGVRATTRNWRTIARLCQMTR